MTAFCLTIWAVGVAVLLARLIHGGYRVARICREAATVDRGRLGDVLARVEKVFGLPGPPRLLMSDRLSTAVAAGWVRPAVIVPRSYFESLSSDELFDVLVHEMAHLIRRDPLIVLLQRFSEAAYWPHPLVHLLNRRLSRAREEICDNYVLRQTDPRSYARLLLRLVESLPGSAAPAGMPAFISPRWDLKQRVEGLVDLRRRPSIAPTRRLLAVTATVFLIVGLVVAGVRLTDGHDSRTVAAETQPASPIAAASRSSSEAELLPGGASIRLGGSQFQGAGAEVTFTPDGNRLVSLTQDSLKFWDIASGRLVQRIPLQRKDRRALWTPDGNRIATQVIFPTPSSSIEFWDSKTGKLLSTFGRAAADSQTGADLMAFTPDGSAGIFGDSQGSLRVLDLATGREIAKRQNDQRGIVSVAVSPNGKLLAITTLTNRLYLWDWQSPKAPVAIASGRRFLSVAFSPDGTRLAVGPDVRRDIQIFNVKTAKQELSLKDDESRFLRVSTETFTPDGKLLVAANAVHPPGATAGAILVWDAHSGVLRARYSIPGTFPRHFAISRDGQLLATCGAGVIHLWNLATGKSLVEPSVGHTSAMLSVVFSPASDRVVTTSQDATARIWDARTGRPIHKLQHDGIVWTAAISPDGTRVATSAFDDTVRLWHTQSGREIRQLKGHGKFGGQRALQFSREGSALYSYGDDQAIRLWSVPDGKLLRELVLRPSEWLGRNAIRDGNLREALDEVRGSIHCCCFPPGGGKLVVARAEEYLVFDTATGKQLVQRALKLKPVSMWCDADRRIVVGSMPEHRIVKHGLSGESENFAWPCQLAMIDLESGTVIWSIEPKAMLCTPVVMSADGKLIAAGIETKSGLFIRLYDARNGTLLSTIEGADPIHGFRAGAAFSPDGKRLAFAQNSPSVLIWDLDRIAPQSHP
jgi:WD40 repeat protein